VSSFKIVFGVKYIVWILGQGRREWELSGKRFGFMYLILGGVLTWWPENGVRHCLNEAFGKHLIPVMNLITQVEFQISYSGPSFLILTNYYSLNSFFLASTRTYLFCSCLSYILTSSILTFSHVTFNLS